MDQRSRTCGHRRRARAHVVEHLMPPPFKVELAEHNPAGQKRLRRRPRSCASRSIQSYLPSTISDRPLSQVWQQSPFWISCRSSATSMTWIGAEMTSKQSASHGGASSDCRGGATRRRTSAILGGGSYNCTASPRDLPISSATSSFATTFGRDQISSHPMRMRKSGAERFTPKTLTRMAHARVHGSTQSKLQLG